MVNVLKVVINGTDYGSSGNGAFVRMEPHPIGPGMPLDTIGTVAVYLTKAGGGGYTITNRMHVQIYEQNGATIGTRHFGGFIATPHTTRPQNTSQKEWELLCQDYNLLGQRIVTDVINPTPGAVGFTVTSAILPTQMQSIIDQIQAAGGGSYAGIDATSQVPDVGVTLPTVVLEGGHKLWWYVDALLTNAQVLNPALNLKRYFGVDNLPGPIFGVPVLYVYDDATPATATVTYSDTPTGGQRGYAGWDRLLEGANLYHWQQAVKPAGDGQTVLTSQDSGSLSSYPNPFYGLGWCEEPLKADGNITDAEAQALLDGTVLDAAYPVETLTLHDPTHLVLPGTVVGVTQALEGLSAAVYRVAEASPSYPTNSLTSPHTELVLGSPGPKLGQPRGASRRVVDRDRVGPLPPGAPTLLRRTFDPVSKVARFWLQIINSPSADIAAHALVVTYRSYTFTASAVAATGPAPATTELDTGPILNAKPGTNISIKALGYDLAGNPGTLSTAYAGSIPYAPGPQPPPMETVDPDATSGLTVQGWYADTSGGGTALRSTSNIYVGATGIRLTT